MGKTEGKLLTIAGQNPVVLHTNFFNGGNPLFNSGHKGHLENKGKCTKSELFLTTNFILSQFCCC